MDATLLLSITAIMALVPAAILPWRLGGIARPSLVSWSVLAAALAGVGAVIALRLADADWSKGFSLALWLSIAATLLAFLMSALADRKVWGLQLLLFPYLLLFALLATLWEQTPGATALAAPPPGWLWLHIASSLLTYGFATLAAMAAVAVFLQERALKRREQSRLSPLLPALSDGEQLERRLLLWAEVILALGIATGMALEYVETGSLLLFDHKTLLALLAFVLIGVVLLLVQRGSLRGRLAARIVLVAYLLLTLAYPGVKFVTDILLAPGV